MRVAALKPHFVTSVPENLEDDVLYVSMVYRNVIHKCCCGCGHEVVTPLSPTDWNLTFDGVSISLSPSVGNWSLPCRSHYWITGNSVVWAEQWSDDQISAARAHDQFLKSVYYETKAENPAGNSTATNEQKKQSLLQRILMGVRRFWS